MDLLRLILAHQPLERVMAMKPLFREWSFIRIRLTTVNQKEMKDFAAFIEKVEDYKLPYLYAMYCTYGGELSSLSRKFAPATLLMMRSLFLREWGSYFYFSKYKHSVEKIVWKALESDDPEIQALTLAECQGRCISDAIVHHDDVRNVKWTAALRNLVLGVMTRSEVQDNDKFHYLYGYLRQVPSSRKITIAELEGIIESQVRGGYVVERNQVIESAIEAIDVFNADIVNICVLGGYLYPIWGKQFNPNNVSPLEAGIRRANPDLIRLALAQPGPKMIPDIAAKLKDGMSRSMAEGCRELIETGEIDGLLRMLMDGGNRYLRIISGLPVPPDLWRSQILARIAHPDVRPGVERLVPSTSGKVSFFYDVANLARTNPPLLGEVRRERLFELGQLLETSDKIFRWFGKIKEPIHQPNNARNRRYPVYGQILAAEKSGQNDQSPALPREGLL